MPNIKFLDSPFIISSFVGEKCLIFCLVSSAVNLAVELVLFAWCFFSLEVVRVGIRKGGFVWSILVALFGLEKFKKLYFRGRDFIFSSVYLSLRGYADK